MTDNFNAISLHASADVRQDVLGNLSGRGDRDLPKDPSVLRTIVREAAQCVGSYAVIANGGPLAVGDEVALE